MCDSVVSQDDSWSGGRMTKVTRSDAEPVFRLVPGNQPVPSRVPGTLEGQVETKARLGKLRAAGRLAPSMRDSLPRQGMPLVSDPASLAEFGVARVMTAA